MTTTVLIKENTGVNKCTYTIRPKFYDGESLSSYIYRFAKVNHINFNDLLKNLGLIKGQLELKNKKASRLDILPSKAINIQEFLRMSGKTLEELEKASFTELYRKLNYRDNSDVYFLNMTSNLWHTQTRYFCPICIRKTPNYKLKWQIKELQMCNQHRCLLTNKCLHCNAEQKYLNPNNLQSYCWKCKKPLSGKVEFVKDRKFISNQHAIEQEWDFLLCKNGSIIGLINGFNLEQSFAISLLYFIQHFQENEKITEEKFNVNKLKKVIRHDYINRLLRLIVNSSSPGSVTFPQLLKILRGLNKTIFDFTMIQVPNNYVQSLKEYYYTRPKLLDKPRCEFIYCKSYGTNQSMSPVEKRNIQKKHTSYNFPHYCKECFMQYGYNNQNKEWVSMDNYIHLFPKIKEELNKGLSKAKIRRRLQIGEVSFYKGLGYLLQNNLLNNEANQKYIKKVVKINEYEAVNCFKELYYSKKICRVIEARKRFGINKTSYYYYYYLPSTQKFLLTAKTKRRMSLTQNEVENKVEEYILNCINNKMEIKLKDCVSFIKGSYFTLKKFDLNKRISEAKLGQKKIAKEQRVNEIKTKVADFLSEKRKKFSRVLSKEIYIEIGLARNYLIRYYPEIEKWIQSEFMEYKKSLKSGYN